MSVIIDLDNCFWYRQDVLKSRSFTALSNFLREGQGASHKETWRNRTVLWPFSWLLSNFQSVDRCLYLTISINPETLFLLPET